jgi:hypothetical protein
VRIYLDNYSFNRPYDDQTQIKIEVETERFISLLHVEPFDYTEWRRTNLFPDIYVSEISKQAMEYRNAKRRLENL